VLVLTHDSNTRLGGIVATNIPTLYIETRNPNPTFPGSDIVTVYCDRCGKLHTHGLPDGANEILPVERASHCGMNKPNAYSAYLIDERK
jgi:hypothetical protein